jgi:hypothetical protein
MIATRATIDALPIFPLLVRDFLREEDRKSLLEFVLSSEVAFGAFDSERDYWAGRTLMPSDIGSPEVLQLFRDIRDRVIATLHIALTEQLGPQPALYADLVNFARWPEGYELASHADSENPGGVPHAYPWRDFASVIYLNDDYAGGEIFFPNQGIELRPEPGTLVLFPGTLRYLHGVRRVNRGMRQTIASFITFDESKHYEF